MIRMRFAVYVALVISFFGGISSGAQPPAWETEIEAALGRAASENKDLLVVFQGPAVNPKCKRMNEEILESNEFRNSIGSEFVLLRVPAPEDVERGPAEEAAYKALLKRFKVQIYPIVYAARSDGRVYGEFVLQDQEMQVLKGEIGKLRPRRALVDKALQLAAADPVDAEALSDALAALGERFAVVHQRDLVDELIDLDADQSKGQGKLWRDHRYRATTLASFDQIYAAIALELWDLKSAEEMVALLDQQIEKYQMEGELRQLFEMQKARSWGRFDQYQKMIDSLLVAKELAPDSKPAMRIPQMIEQLEKKLQAQADHPAKVSSGAPATSQDEEPAETGRRRMRRRPIS